MLTESVVGIMITSCSCRPTIHVHGGLGSVCNLSPTPFIHLSLCAGHFCNQKKILSHITISLPPTALKVEHFLTIHDTVQIQGNSPHIPPAVHPVCAPCPCTVLALEMGNKHIPANQQCYFRDTEGEFDWLLSSNVNNLSLETRPALCIPFLKMLLRIS